MIAAVDSFTHNVQASASAPQTPETPTPQGIALGQPLSPQPSRQETIDWLLTLELPPLPCAPAQDPHLYPLTDKSGAIVFDKEGNPKPNFGGKNPSYLDAKNKPCSLSHKPLQKRLPNASELKKWFANPSNGVGALGSEKWALVDLDRHRFDVPGLDATEAQALCDAAANQLISNVVAQTQKLPPYERTQSGGWRVVLGLNKPHNFTNFSITPGGDHVGEVLKVGRYAVFAPTIGPSGNAYEAYHRCPVEEIPVIDSLEDIGLYPTGGKAKSTEPSTLPLTSQPPTPTSTPTDAMISQSATPIPQPSIEVREGVVSLEDLASEDAQEVLKGTDVKKDKSGSLTLAIKDWQGWENWCQANNVQYMGSTEALAHLAGERLGIDKDRVSRILDSINLSSCTPSAVFRGKSDAWCMDRVNRLASGRSFCGGIGSGSGGSGGGGNNRRGTGGSGGDGGDGGDGGEGNDNGKVVKFPKFYVLSDAELEAEIEKLIAETLPESKITSLISRLAQYSQRSPLEVRKQYLERLNEIEFELEREANYEWVLNLRRIAEEDLSLSDYLPSGLAEPLSQWCTWLSINQSVILTALLTATSSLHAVGTELMFQEGYNFRVNPTIFSALIGESGVKKSPIFNNISKDPLHVLRQEKVDAYKAEMEDYKKELRAWNQLPKEERAQEPAPEPPPPPRLYYFDDATGEAIGVQAEKAPNKALFGLFDELSGFFDSRNAYRSSAKGQDKQDILSFFDGTGKTVLRVGDGVRTDQHKIYLSLCGTIQPEVLKRHMGDCSDDDGHWARFIFVKQPLRASRLASDNGINLNLKERLADIYRKIDNLPPIKYRLSREAFAEYQIVYDQLERLKLKSKPGMRAMYSKMEGYIGRLAINLHVLWELAAGKACPAEEIPLYIMEMAIQLAKFFVSQVKAIHAEADDENVPAHIAKMISLSKRLQEAGDKSEGWLKAKNVSDHYGSKKRPKATTIYAWMQEADAMGLGSIRGAGNRMEFRWQPQGGNDSTDGVSSPDGSPPEDNFRNVRNTLGNVPNNVPKAESVENKGVEEDFRNFRNFRNDFSTPEISTQTTPPPVETLSPDSAKLPLKEENVPKVPNDSSNADVPSVGDSRNTLGTLPKVPKVAESTLTVEESPTVIEVLVPKVPKPSPNVDSNVDAVSDMDFRNDVRNTLGTLPKVPKVAENLLVQREVANEMIQCATQDHVETLYAQFPKEQIDAAKELLKEDERLTFEAIATPCASNFPAVVEVAQTPSLVGRRIRGKNRNYTSFGQTYTICRQEGDILHYIKGPGLGCLAFSEIGSAWELLE